MGTSRAEAVTDNDSRERQERKGPMQVGVQRANHTTAIGAVNRNEEIPLQPEPEPIPNEGTGDWTPPAGLKVRIATPVGIA